MVKNERFIIACVVLIAGLVPLTMAQTPTPTTPTPLPGTPVQICCFDPDIAGFSALQQVEPSGGWTEFDSFAQVLTADNADYPIKIRMIEAAFLPPSEVGAFQVRIYEVVDEDALPNVDAAGRQLWQGAYGIPSTASQLTWATMDFADHSSDPADWPVINNPGQKFIVRFTFFGEENPALLPCADADGFCPPGTFVAEANLVHEIPQLPDEGGWYYKEDAGASTNFVVRVRYYSNVEPVYFVPTTSGFGIGLLLVLISLPLFRKIRRNR